MRKQPNICSHSVASAGAKNLHRITASASTFLFFFVEQNASAQTSFCSNAKNSS
jgi:hypothetical protein